MITYILLTCNSLSDTTAIVSVLISAATLWVAWIIYRKYAAQQLLSKQIEAVYELIGSLHNDSIKLCFAFLTSDGGYTGEDSIMNVFEIASVSKSVKVDWKKHNDLPIYFESRSNQIFDLKKFIQNPFIPKSISDELVKFYSIHYDFFDASKEISADQDIVQAVIISSLHYDESYHSLPEFEQQSIYKNTSAVALQNWLSLTNCSISLQESITNWLINNGIKKEDVNIRTDFINKPK